MIRSLLHQSAILVALIASSVIVTPLAQADGDSSIRRLVLAVGANQGGEGRVTLRYAGTDADRVAKLTREIGGVSASDIVVLKDSKLSSLVSALATLEERLARARSKGVRVEVVFYYSGHSDEKGLLLRGEGYSYKELRDRISALPADVKIAVLDSCASGAFTRTKGGSHRPAFLVDESSRVEGYAFIASSSETELAQESDRIASSFFTHYLVSGLRGGADSNRDGRVTLNEAYQYAFDETVSRTESTQAGTQHPAYNMHLAGTGDVVMTDLRSTDASLVLVKDLLGRFFVRDSRGDLVIEITKKRRHSMTLGLAPGTYSIVLKQEDRLSKASVELAQGKVATLAAANFRSFEGEAAVTRGGAATPAPQVEGESKRTETVYFGASLLPSVGTTGTRVRRNISINFIGGSVAEIDGVEIGVGINHVSDNIRGAQFSAIANVVGGDLRGVQAAGIGNVGAGNIRGAQLAGVANMNTGHIRGLQASGVANYAGSFRGIQAAGVANFVEGEARGLQMSGTANRADHVQGFQLSGVANLASTVNGGQIGVVNVATGKVSGLQLGVVNVADESDVSIGLVNIIHKGYRALDVWTSDSLPVQVGFKMGSKKFYTMIAAAQGTDSLMAGFGAGFHAERGTHYIDVDALAYGRAALRANDGELQFIDAAEEENDLLAQIRAAVGWRITRDIALFGGISLNSSFAFGTEGTDEAIIHKVHRDEEFTLRYGPGFFAGASWNLGGY